MRYIVLVFFLAIGYTGIQAQEEISVADIWETGKLSTRGVPGFNFMQDGRHYTRRIGSRINTYDITSGEMVGTLFDGREFRDKQGYNGLVSSFSFSANENFIIIASETESVYRHSSKSQFYIYNIDKKTIEKLFDGDKQMYATMSPDEKSIAFVVANNLYIKDISSGTIMQVTKDGEVNRIINGATDWVYEEEFSMSRAFEWSPDSRYLGYMRFDETNVKEFIMTKYSGDLYPEYVKFKYPKVGETLAEVEIKIYDMKSKKSVTASFDETPFYIPRIQWTNTPGNLSITTLNRHQNNLQLFIADAKSGDTELALREQNKYYVDVHDNLRFFNDGYTYLWTSERDGFQHIYLQSLDGEIMKDLTPGEFDVTDFYGFDEARNEIYYRAADESPMTRNVYRLNIKTGEKTKLNKLDGYNSVQLSSTYDYFVLTYSTINSPSTYVVYDRDGDEIRLLEDNSALRDKMKQYGVQPVEFYQFKNRDGVTLNGYTIKPRDFDPNKKYPVFMYLYGGPNSQQVIDSWRGPNYWWFQMLADKGYIVACTDNRGTGARGEEFRKMTYLQLGHYETLDQIDAAKHLASLDYVDPDRIGIFGWSYGGFMSSLCLFKGEGVFDMAIAVAPVTKWAWYDAIYTERFMRTEAENPDGYRQNSPVYFAEHMEGDYLLIHGGADDNVHVQNSMEMSKALMKAGKQFDVYFYPNSNHGIYHDGARSHLYTKMTDFILEKL